MGFPRYSIGMNFLILIRIRLIEAGISFLQEKGAFLRRNGPFSCFCPLLFILFVGFLDKGHVIDFVVGNIPINNALFPAESDYGFMPFRCDQTINRQ